MIYFDGLNLFYMTIIRLKLEVIIVAIYRHLMSIYSGFLQFVMAVVQACV